MHNVEVRVKGYSNQGKYLCELRVLIIRATDKLLYVKFGHLNVYHIEVLKYLQVGRFSSCKDKKELVFVGLTDLVDYEEEGEIPVYIADTDRNSILRLIESATIDYEKFVEIEEICKDSTSIQI